ncbi:DNA-directed RNA polymerase [Coemansia sp. RSA 2399]|nr:DNA-directed RNA polymerase [Coemansia sp. RSA 2399]KAJ1891488.1 DNA-directed RNA polymerase [Coemansia sp. IMI 209127]
MATVTWTTPVGLTVTQPYRKFSQRLVNTQLQSITVYDRNMPSPVNSQKQKTAFPPNFVHSLDASHMVLSAIECKIAGLVFASVHDSYWTHACDIDRMNEILRDQFVQLHELEIMENLKTELEQRYADHKMPTRTWEYASASALKIQKKGSKTGKAEKQLEEEQIIESSLADQHLQFCNDEDVQSEPLDSKTADAGTNVLEAENKSADDADAASSSANEHVVYIDLETVKLVDPKEDLAGALRQEDCIAYTLSVNIANQKKRRSAIFAEYKKISAIKKAKGKGKGKEAMPVSDEAAVMDTNDEAALLIQQLERERDAKLAEVKTSYVTEFKRKPIMVTQSRMLGTYKNVDSMTAETGVSGRFIPRLVWVDIEFDPLPKQGGFDIKEVRNSPYFFS